MNNEKSNMYRHFDEWVRHYTNAVYALAYSRIGDWHYAQDIVQETFLKAYLNLHTLQDQSKFGSWVYTIAARTSTDWARSNRVGYVRLDSSDQLQDNWSTEDIVLGRESRDEVWRVLELLDESSRMVLVLFHMNDWSLQQIADFLNLGVKAVDSRLRRAREKLKDLWSISVEKELITRRTSVTLQEKLLRLLSEGTCDRILVKEGLQLTGDLDDLFAMTAKHYRVPLLIECTAKTDSTNIRLSYARGKVILNWEHDANNHKYNDPTDGTSEVIRNFGGIELEKWARVQWYIDERLSAIFVDGRLLHATRSDYEGLTSAVGIGPAWSSIVTVKAFRVTEGPVLRPGPLLELAEANRADRQNIRMLTRYSPDRFKEVRSHFEWGRPHVMLTFESVATPGHIWDRLRSADPPDLVPLRPQDINPAFERGLIMDLTPFAERDPLLMNELYGGLIANAMVRDKLAVIPTEPRLPGILYKKDRFDEAGISYPRPGWTWTEFLDIATRLNRRDDAGNAEQYGLVIQQDWLFVESMIVSNGGSILSQDGTKAVGYLDADPAVEAVQAFVDLFRLHRVAPLHHDPILQPMNFYNDKIGMFGEGTWMAGEGHIDVDTRVGTVGMPIMRREHRSSSAIVGGYAIAAHSRNPELAWEILKLLITPPEWSAKEWTRHSLAWSKTIAERSNQQSSPYLGPFLEDLPYIRKRASTLNPRLLNSSLTNGVLSRLIRNGDDVRQTLEELARTLDYELAT